MNSAQDLRYESKLVLQRQQLPALLGWVHGRTPVARAYPDRYVNSVYFDTFRMSCVRDNIIGLPNRSKYRLRWYHDADKSRARGLRFEVKHRVNRAGRKDSYEIADPLGSLLGQRFSEMSRVIAKCIPGQSAVPHECLRNPTLQVCYRRSYFTLGSEIRLTVDSDIEFYDLLSSSRLYQRKPRRYPRHVVEFKFPVSVLDHMTALLRTANFTLTRHSKYVVGLSTFGYVVYL